MKKASLGCLFNILSYYRNYFLFEVAAAGLVVVVAATGLAVVVLATGLTVDFTATGLVVVVVFTFEEALLNAG